VGCRVLTFCIYIMNTAAINFFLVTAPKQDSREDVRWGCVLVDVYKITR